MTLKQQQHTWNRLNATRRLGTVHPPLVEDGVMGPKTSTAFALANGTIGVNWDTLPIEYAVDSLCPVLQDNIDLLRHEVGSLPLQWGRYVNNIDVHEIDLLVANGIKPTLIGHSGRAHTVSKPAQAKADACNDLAHALALSQYALSRHDIELGSIHLDVEMDDDKNPWNHLDPQYWYVWATEVQEAGFSPRVYLPNRNWVTQWGSLDYAIKNGAPCDGIWTAWYDKTPDSRFVDIPVGEPTRSSAPNGFERLNALVRGRQYLGDMYGQRFDFSWTVEGGL